MTPLATYEETDNLAGPNLASGRRVNSTRCSTATTERAWTLRRLCFLWMCYADAFLMFLVSLKHHVTAAQEDALKNSDLIRMMTMLRNVTVHQAVVSTASPLIMINRIISIGNPQGRREYVVLNTARVTEKCWIIMSRTCERLANGAGSGVTSKVRGGGMKTRKRRE